MHFFLTGPSAADVVAAERDRLSRGLGAAVEAAAAGILEEARGALGPKLGRMLGSRTRPASEGRINPAASLFGRGGANGLLAPYLDDGEVVVLPRRGRFLCFPTGFNAHTGRGGSGGWRGRGERGVRVTPTDMVESRQSFITPFKRGDGFLWCLKVSDKGVGSKRALVAGGLSIVATAHKKGRHAWLDGLVSQGFVPMFFLMPSVTVFPRANIGRIADRWFGRLPDMISFED